MKKLLPERLFFVFLILVYTIQAPADKGVTQKPTGQVELAAWALKLKDRYQGVTPVDVNNARKTLLSELDRLDEYLPDNEDGAGW